VQETSDAPAPVVHDDNEWNICVVSSSEVDALVPTSSSAAGSGSTGTAATPALVAPEGTQYLDYAKDQNRVIAEDDIVHVQEEDNISSLMDQLKALNQ
jgi:hypothetical protein